MKSQKNTQKLYEETLAEVEKAENICLNCGRFKKEHFPGPHGLYCGEKFSKPEDDGFTQFKLNTMALVGLQNRLKILEWVLGQEETYVSIDDAIMPETIVATYSIKTKEIDTLLPVQEFDVKIDGLDEPYRGMLLSLSNKLPITLPGVMEEKVQLVCFAIFPSGAVYRNYGLLEEEFIRKVDDPKFVLSKTINIQMIEEILNRYGRK